MEIKLELTFNEYTEKDKLNRVINSTQAYGALYEIMTYLRHDIDISENNSDIEDLLSEIISECEEILDNNGIDFDRDYP